MLPLPLNTNLYFDLGVHQTVMKWPPGEVAVWCSVEEWALELRQMWVWNIVLSLTSSGYLVSYSKLSVL